MMNLELLKNINSLLSQVIDLSESEFSAGKWLDFATNAAKQLGDFSSGPLSPLSSREDPVSGRRNHPTSSSSEYTGPEMNSMNLWKLLEPLNKLLPQITAVGPMLNAFMKPKDGEPANPRHTANAGGGFFIKKTVLNSLTFALLPVLLMNFVLKFR